MRIVTISFAVSVMASGRLALVERDRRRDEAHVREGLGEVAHRLVRGPLDLLAEESHVVRVGAEPLEAALRPLVLARIGEILDGPEAARREGVLAPVHAVGGPLRTVALDELVLH